MGRERSWVWRGVSVGRVSWQEEGERREWDLPRSPDEGDDSVGTREETSGRVRRDVLNISGAWFLVMWMAVDCLLERGLITRLSMWTVESMWFRMRSRVIKPSSCERVLYPHCVTQPVYAWRIGSRDVILYLHNWISRVFSLDDRGIISSASNALQWPSNHIYNGL